MLTTPERIPNLNPEFLRAFAARLGLRFVAEASGEADTFSPEDIFHYAYAIFHSPQYRERYAEFLKIDFPRLPLTSSAPLFRQLGALGGELVAWHLLRHPKLGGGVSAFATRFPIAGDNLIAPGHPKFSEAKQRVHINKEQYFAGIEPATWEHMVGGYQVLKKWLADRKGRALSIEDIQHYQKIVLALGETQRLMAEIDAAIGNFPLP